MTQESQPEPTERPPERSQTEEALMGKAPPERGGAAAPSSLSGDRIFFRVVVLVFLLVFLYVLRDGLSPLLVGVTLLGLIVLAQKGVRFEIGIGIVACVLLAAWFLSEVAGLLWPFAVSFVLAYLMAPLVDLIGRRISRSLAIGIIVLLLLGILSGIGVVVVPKVIDEVRELVRRLPSYGTAVKDLYERGLGLIREYGYEVQLGEIQQWLVERLPEVGKIFADKTTAALKGLTSGLAALLNLLMIPFVTFYVLKDYDKITRSLQGVLPRHLAGSSQELLQRIDEVLGQYIRGQLLVCSFIAVLTGFGLAISGIPYAVLLGLMAGISNLIPYVGLAVSLGVTAVVALLDADPLMNLLKVIVVFVVVQGIEGNFLSPRVVGERVGLHPAWVMFALVVAAHFWGMIGMLIAIPGAAVLNILINILTGRYFSSQYYDLSASPPEKGDN